MTRTVSSASFDEMGRGKKQPSSKPPTTTTSVAAKHLRSEFSGEECVTCRKIVNDEGVECQWCFNWEHKTCAGLTQNEYILLSKSSGNIMFYCSSCFPKVNDALAQYAKKCESVSPNPSDRLSVLEEKLVRLSDQLELLVSQASNTNNLPVIQNTLV